MVAETEPSAATVEEPPVQAEEPVSPPESAPETTQQEARPDPEALRTLQSAVDRRAAELAASRTDVIEQRARAMADKMVAEREPQIRQQTQEVAQAQNIIGWWNSLDRDARAQAVAEDDNVVPNLQWAQETIKRANPDPQTAIATRFQSRVLEGLEQLPFVKANPDRWAQIRSSAPTAAEAFLQVMQLAVDAEVDAYRKGADFQKLVQDGIEEKLRELRPKEGQPVTVPGEPTPGNGYWERIDRINSGTATASDEEWYRREGPGRHLS